MVMRGRKRKGVRYFGPYAHAYAIRETLDLLLRTFPIRTCCPAQVRASTSGSAARACCSTSRSAPGPCVGEIDEERYHQLVAELFDFLDGDTDTDRQAARGRDAGGGRRSSSSSGRPGCATG